MIWYSNPAWDNLSKECLFTIYRGYVSFNYTKVVGGKEITNERWYGMGFKCDEIESLMNDPENPTREDFEQAVAKLARPLELLRKHRASYENACADLYYGYSYKVWYEGHKDEFESEEDAKIVWQMAFNKMANA